jgi:alpha/beta superfamily hydrolase
VREEPQRIAGRLEGTLRIPDSAPTAIVVIAHPLPTHGGSMRNPLIAFLARIVADQGWYALRFNFRGVGKSDGAWSGGRQEHRDLGDAVAHARYVAPGLPLAVVGFSFGALTTLRWIERGGRPDTYILLGLPLRSERGEERADRPPVPAGAFVMNGEMDAFGAASEIREAYPQAQVIAIAGSDHFFTGKRDELGRIVTDHLALALASR